MLVSGEWKTGVPKKKTRGQRRELITNSTHTWCRRRKSKTGHIGGRWDETALTATPPLLPTLTHASKYHFHKIELDRLSTWQKWGVLEFRNGVLAVCRGTSSPLHQSGLREMRCICSTHLQMIRKLLEQIYSPRTFKPHKTVKTVRQLVSPTPLPQRWILLRPTPNIRWPEATFCTQSIW